MTQLVHPLLETFIKTILFVKGRTIIFLSWGGGGGYHFWDLKTIFFQRVMRFKQFFFITFCNEIIFLRQFLKHVTGFFIDLIWKKHFLCMHTHESLIGMKQTHPEYIIYIY